MRVRRLGFAAVKGTRHLSRPVVELAADGPRGDRRYAVADPATGRVLRTVDHPALARVEAEVEGGLLRLRLPDGTLVDGPAEPGAIGQPGGTLHGDYWGRPATLRLLDGSHDAALTAYLGRPATLVATEPGAVVWGAPVSLVTTGELERLAERLGAAGATAPAALDERFRATVTLEADHDPEPGTLLRLGAAVVEVVGRIDRCAVIDADPRTGLRDSRLLRHLEQRDGLPTFGVDAHVLAPGTVRLGDPGVVHALDPGTPERAAH
ncbi:MOSC domain-containing protein [Pedococcus sp. NPDC057267]|uniref:MOSC domain-containing protein n=1 Tax=Pedococcus sp. NPDC057267 TaxID=3346077 RepID=UPI003642AA7D